MSLEPIIHLLPDLAETLYEVNHHMSEQVSYASRSVRVSVLNATDKDIVRGSFDATHGSFHFPIDAVKRNYEPPERIQRYKSGWFVCAETGIFTGAQGWATYYVEGNEDQYARFDFHVPYIANNEYSCTSHGLKCVWTIESQGTEVQSLVVIYDENFKNMCVAKFVAIGWPEDDARKMTDKIYP